MCRGGRDSEAGGCSSRKAERHIGASGIVSNGRGRSAGDWWNIDNANRIALGCGVGSGAGAAVGGGYREVENTNRARRAADCPAGCIKGKTTRNGACGNRICIWCGAARGSSDARRIERTARSASKCCRRQR